MKRLIQFFKKERGEMMKRLIRFFKAVSIVYRDGFLDVLFRDPLTKLYNRRFLEEVGEKEIAKAKRYSRSLSIILIDIDGFKQFNDIFGHLKGDKVLKEMAEVMTSYCRKTDLIFRWGGDEFLMIFPETNQREARVLMERITEELRSRNIQISYGIALWGENFGSLEELIDEADEQLYCHKKTKKA
jgi:diguanylate cyclase (GGDEF)-like protein